MNEATVNLDPIEVTFLGVPGTVVLWILTLVAYGVFGWRVRELIGLLRKGDSDYRFDQLGKRVKNFVTHVLLQPRLFNERSVGWAHFLIFWGFVVSVTCFNWNLVLGLFPFLPIPYPEEVGPVVWFMEIFAVLVLAGLAAVAVRRAFFAPPHLHLSWDANFILGLIAILMLATLLGQGARVAVEGHLEGAAAPFGRLIATWIQQSPVLADSAAKLATGAWWVHMVGVLLFVIYLPYSKHLHLLAAPFNVFFSSLRPLGDLSQASSSEDASAGASRWTEFTWKQLLSGFSCSECGRCDRACPALTSGDALSPQQLIQKIKGHLLTVALQNSKLPSKDQNGQVPLIGKTILETEPWACTTCMACMERCAVMNEQIPLIIQMRRHLVSEGKMDRTVQEMLANVTRYGNSFGKSERLRAKWTQGLDWKIKDARKEPVKFLWYVGDYASFDSRVEEITRTTARIFHQADLDFGILYEGERNAGNDVRRIGEEGLFDMLKERNLKTLGKCEFEALVSTDPHTYNTLKNEYGSNGDGPPVLHYTEVLDQLLQQGRLPIEKELNQRVTYHDPCYLGRYNGVYEPPRRLLRSLGAEVVEMPRNRERSYCCGAGGGRIWMEDTPGIQERPSESRIREVAALPGVTVMAVACPKDIAMFRDAIKTTGNEGKIEVKDIADLVWEAMAM